MPIKKPYKLCPLCGDREHQAYCPKPAHISKERWQSFSVSSKIANSILPPPSTRRPVLRQVTDLARATHLIKRCWEEIATLKYPTSTLMGELHGFLSARNAFSTPEPGVRDDKTIVNNSSGNVTEASNTQEGDPVAGCGEAQPPNGGEPLQGTV